MQTQDLRKTSSSGHGVHVCHKCGWPFPNPHPSAKNRRSHKKICGTIEGYKIANSEENKDDDDDDSKSPSLDRASKAADMTIIRRNSSGVGSRSSRSDWDVFTDASADFGDAPAVAGYVAVRDRAAVTQVDGENAVADAGDLYPPNSDNGTQAPQLQNAECSMPENEGSESEMSSQLHLSSSAVDSISYSDSSVKEASVSENTLPCSKIDIVLDSEDKGSLEASLVENSKNGANNPFETAGNTSEVEFVPASVAVGVIREQIGDNNDCSVKGMVEEEKSEDLTNIPTDFVAKLSEAVFMPQMGTEDDMEFLPANADMEVNGEQRKEFDAKNDCFSKDKLEDLTDIPADFAGNSSEAVSVPQMMADDMEFLPANADMEVNGEQRKEFDAKNDCFSKDKLEDLTDIPADFAGNSSEAVSVPQMMAVDNFELLPANADMEVNGEQSKDFDAKNDCFSKDKLGDLTNIPADFAGNSSEAVSVPQMVAEDNFEFLPANAVMELISEDFDARNDCFSKDDIVGKMNGIEESSNVEVGSSLDVDNTHVTVLPDALPLKEFSEDVLPDDIALDLAQESEYVDHGMDKVNKEAFFSMSVAEPNKSLKENSEQIISEVLNEEDSSYEDVSVGKKMESNATDADICESKVVHPDKDEIEIERAENSPVCGDTNLHSVLDDSDNFAHSISDPEHDIKEAQIFDALEAESAKVEEEKIPVINDCAVDYDVKSREVEENLSRSTPTLPQSDAPMDDEYGCKVAMSESSKANDFKLQDSEIEDNVSSSNQPVVEESANFLGTTVISGTENNPNTTEQTHFGENCARKASDSVDFSVLNNASNHDAQLDENGVFEDAKELQNLDEKVSGIKCSGKVDLGLISDNDDDLVLTQNRANKLEAGVHDEAVSAVEDYLTEKKEGGENFVQQEEHVQELDAQVDSVSQTDSVEGNWGSVSVLSAFSDAPAGNESSLKTEKSTLPPKSKLPEDKTSLEQKGDLSDRIESSSTGSKKEETMAKVTNWSTSSGKQHMSLKSILGDDSSSPNNAKDNPRLKLEETEKAVTTNAKDHTDDSIGGMQKEWSSPARYPTNIKREKGKVKSKSYWVPFICCSSNHQ